MARRFAKVGFFLHLCVMGSICAQRGLASREGYITVPGGRVWYRIVGSGGRTPLLVLHGGRGAASYYLKALAALADDRPVVFYDRLGVGHSDPPADTSVWRVDRAVEELALVRESLHLKEVYLYGHSWGTMLAVEYLLRRPAPEGVRGLILAGPALSVPRLRRDVAALRATLPDSVQQAFARHEREGTCDAPEYRAAVAEFQRRFFARRRPFTADAESSIASARRSDSLYRRMGARPCTWPGAPASTYDPTDRLSEISVPTLLTAGRYEMPTPETMLFYQSRLRGSRLVILEHSGHVTIQDEPDQDVLTIREFLHRVEDSR